MVSFSSLSFSLFLIKCLLSRYEFSLCKKACRGICVQIEKVDRKSLAHSYSRRSSTLTSESNTSSSFASRPSVLRIEMEDILCLAPTADLSLPPGGGFCIDTDAGPQYLVCFFLSSSLPSRSYPITLICDDARLGHLKRQYVLEISLHVMYDKGFALCCVLYIVAMFLTY